MSDLLVLCCLVSVVIVVFVVIAASLKASVRCEKALRNAPYEEREK